MRPFRTVRGVMTPREGSRLLPGFAAASVVATAVTSGLLGIGSQWTATARYLPNVVRLPEDLAYLAVASFFFCTVVTVLGAVPSALLLRRRRRLTLRLCLAFGSALGASPFLFAGLAALVSAANGPAPPRLASVAPLLALLAFIGAVAGFSGAIAFFLVGIRGTTEEAGTT